MATRTVHHPTGGAETVEAGAVKAGAGRGGGGLRWARSLSAIMVVLMAAAAAMGLLVDGLYQDPGPVAAMFRGYDLVTLVLAAPVLAITLLPALRRSPRAKLAWVGMLAYSVYHYAIYVFGSAFNDLFLVHTALFSLSVFALALAMWNLDIAGIARRFDPRTPVRTVGAILMLLAVGLGAMWIFYSLRFAVTGQAPEESLLVLPPANQHLGYVLDLALLVPASALAAVLLWRRAALGYLLGTAVAVLGVVYQVNYLVALIFQANAGVPGATPFDPQEPPILAAYLVATGLLLGGVRATEGPTARYG